MRIKRMIKNWQQWLVHGKNSINTRHGDDDGDNDGGDDGCYDDGEDDDGDDEGDWWWWSRDLASPEPWNKHHGVGRMSV